MPSILKGRHNNDFSNKGHYKSNSSNGSVKSEKEVDQKYSVVMVGCGGVGNIKDAFKTF